MAGRIQLLTVYGASRLPRLFGHHHHPGALLRRLTDWYWLSHSSCYIFIQLPLHLDFPVPRDGRWCVTGVELRVFNQVKLIGLTGHYR